MGECLFATFSAPERSTSGRLLPQGRKKVRIDKEDEVVVKKNPFFFGIYKENPYLMQHKTDTMTEEHLIKDEIFGDDLEQVWLVAEAPLRNIAEQLADLHSLKGAGFISMLKEITQQRAFSLLEGESNIYTTGGTKDDDYDNLLNAARKAVEHGYRVFILPNPKGIRTADFIFEKKKNLKVYDLKTISGKASVGNRLFESIGQSNRVLLNINTDYNARLLASDIKSYFEANRDAIEVLIFKGKKILPVNRSEVLSPHFNRIFRKRYEK